MKTFRIQLVCFLLLGLACTVSGQAQTGEAIYQQHCAGCHGKNLEGVNSKPLKKTDWVYGREPKTMLQTILHGLPGTEMVPWREVLTQEQAISVRDFIIEQQDARPFSIRPIPDEIQVGGKSIKLEVVVAEGLDTPWGIEFVDERRALITERPGGLRWLSDGKLDPQPITGLPVPVQYADSGMFDLTLDPEYKKNGWIYIALSQSLDGGITRDNPGMTKIIRGRIDGHQWVDEQTVFSLPDDRYLTRAYRWGGRLLFDREGYLFFSIGDQARDAHVQDLSLPSGKIYRVHSDGTIPDDNPFLGHEGAIPAIYTYGNRNPQGLALHPTTGQIWETEHGPMGGDELNIITKGTNYGWPLVTFGRNYNGAIVSELTEKPGMEPPITQWTPSIAICPAEFYTGSLFPEWKNDLFIGALAYEEIRHLVIKENRVVSQEIVMKNLGRVRDIKTGPDGALYVLLNHPDILLRLTPETTLPQ
jgi:glucose/arabinose dehydrogenase